MDTPRIRIIPAPPYERSGSAIALAEPSAAPSRSPATANTPTPARPPARAGASVSSRTVAAATVEARRFAIATATLIFEVIDRRRALTHVQLRVAPAVLDQIGVLVRTNVARSAGDGTGAARVRRVHIQMCDSAAAEIFGSYVRGQRVRAFAGRVERLPCRVRPVDEPVFGPYRTSPSKVEYRWQLVTFVLS
ncbi:MAG: Rv3235 family protein [Gordonia sp. (in: high G+C Gram-positive bacteria)]